jgi:hypothetical protein
MNLILNFFFFNVVAATASDIKTVFKAGRGGAQMEWSRELKL